MFDGSAPALKPLLPVIWSPTRWTGLSMEQQSDASVPASTPLVCMVATRTAIRQFGRVCARVKTPHGCTDTMADATSVSDDPVNIIGQNVCIRDQMQSFARMLQRVMSDWAQSASRCACPASWRVLDMNASRLMRFLGRSRSLYRESAFEHLQPDRVDGIHSHTRVRIWRATRVTSAYLDISGHKYLYGLPEQRIEADQCGDCNINSSDMCLREIVHVLPAAEHSQYWLATSSANPNVDQVWKGVLHVSCAAHRVG